MMKDLFVEAVEFSNQTTVKGFYVQTSFLACWLILQLV